MVPAQGQAVAVMQAQPQQPQQAQGSQWAATTTTDNAGATLMWVKQGKGGGLVPFSPLSAGSALKVPACYADGPQLMASAKPTSKVFRGPLTSITDIPESQWEWLPISPDDG